MTGVDVLDDTALDRLASGLLQARDDARLTTLPSRGEVGFDLDTGYRVGRVLHERLVERGHRPVGRKIGFTNPATWKEFDLDTPIWAYLYASTVHLADRGCFRLSLGGMVAPRIEPEVVVKLRRAVSGGDLSVEALVDCLEWAAIGFEIVDSHFPGWRFTAADAVADFGVHAALVVGTPWRLEPGDPRRTAAVLRDLTVRLSRGPETVAEGEGRNALGSPVLAVGHLARVIRAQSWAPPLAGGEVITTGTLTALPRVHPGEHWRVDVVGAPLAPLELDMCA